MTTNASGGEPRIRQGHLRGPSRAFDPRITAVRPDLADSALAGLVVAPRYADGVTMHGAVASAMVCAAPDAAALAVSALLYGEGFAVFDIARGWAWGQCLHDGYVGWVPITALGPGGAEDFRIAVPAAAVFAARDIKAQVVASLPLNARLTGIEDGGFVALAGAITGFVHRRHVGPISERCGDPVALALGFVGTPYVWGGRTRDGIDCSGLTQAVLCAAGIAAPRDSDQQAAAFAAVDAADRRRGDLVVFPGHVGLLADADTLVHANAHWMATVVEPLADVVARIAPTGFRRPRYDAVAIPCSAE